MWTKQLIRQKKKKDFISQVALYVLQRFIPGKSSSNSCT